MATNKTPEQRAKNTQLKREWRAKNPERAKAINKSYREKYPERVKAQDKAWKSKNKEKVAAYLRDWHEVKGKWRRYDLKKYGLSIEGYEQLLKDQGGVCAICGVGENELKRRLFVDHCHNTNRVRGLLCPSCNLMLGYCGDDTGILENAIYYLKVNNIIIK